jgi:hypothetical protein
MTPPRLTTWLLEATQLPEAEAIAGDLCEEFQQHVAPTHGALWARCWYWSQVARSIAPLYVRSWQRASLTRASAALMSAAAAATIPTAALLAVRGFALSQVPLKTTAEFSATFAAIVLVVTTISVLIGMCLGLRLLHER